jgi:flagellar biogenesis protein FliO
MGLSLIFIWCISGGLIMRLARDRFIQWSTRLRINWQLRFVILCIAMALIEEAVTTSLTNTAPLFGAVTSAARITSSTNYFKVISGSVVAFIPLFICWAWLLGRYDFQPLEVVLLFGLTGTLAESITFGSQHLAEVGMWTFVYGLMVYLPVYSIPAIRNVHPARWYLWIIAIFLQLVFIIPFVIYLLFAVIKKIIGLFRNKSAI